MTQLDEQDSARWWGSVSIFFLFLFLFFLGLHPQHMEVPRLGLESELQLLAYVTATAMPAPSRACDLYHSSQQCWVLNPLSEARIEPATSWFLVRFVSAVPSWELP